MRVTRLVALEVVACVSAVLLAIAPAAPSTVEGWFSTRLYLLAQRAITPISNRLPFAILDLVILAGICAVLWLVWSTIRASKRRRSLRPVAAGLWHLTAAAAVAYLIFLTAWGFNYRRVPMTERIVLEAGPPAAVSVMALGFHAASELNRLYPAARQDEVVAPPTDNARLRESFTRVQHALADGPQAVPGRLKQTLIGPYFRWAGIDGMINPFGLEILANPDLLPFEVPFIAAHEWAHLAGYADEAEASYVGWLTCLHADPQSQYSGWLSVYWQVSAEVDARTRERLDATLMPGPRADLQAIVARVRRGERPWLRAAGWRLYDRYLKANRVEEGVRSYGAVVTLILLARVDEAGNPIRRSDVEAGLSRPEER